MWAHDINLIDLRMGLDALGVSVTTRQHVTALPWVCGKLAKVMSDFSVQKLLHQLVWLRMNTVSWLSLH